MPFFTQEIIDNRDEKVLFPGVVVRTFWGDQSLIARVVLAPNAEVPTHQHPHEQSGVVVAGELTFEIGDQTMSLHTGDMFLVHGNTPHRAVAGPEGCTTVEIFAPARDDFKY